MMITAKAAAQSAAALFEILMHFFHGFHQSWFPNEATQKQLFVILAKITFQIKLHRFGCPSFCFATPI
jgi:hypothetical protein